MSHKATSWLSDIPASELSNSEFRVLFHLCDCHNPSKGCFPTQSYLIAVCGVSNGTLNNALNSLEARGHIQRHRRFDGKSHRQKPTHYVLGFEIRKSSEPTPRTGDGKAGKPSPDFGDGKRRKPSPKTGDGADSNLSGVPSPISGGSRLQPTGEVTCKEPVINPARDAEIAENAEFWIKKIEEKSFIPRNAIGARIVDFILRSGRLSRQQLVAVGVDC